MQVLVVAIPVRQVLHWVHREQPRPAEVACRAQWSFVARGRAPRAGRDGDVARRPRGFELLQLAVVAVNQYAGKRLAVQDGSENFGRVREVLVVCGTRAVRADE